MSRAREAVCTYVFSRAAPMLYCAHHVRSCLCFPRRARLFLFSGHSDTPTQTTYDDSDAPQTVQHDDVITERCYVLPVVRARHRWRWQYASVSAACRGLTGDSSEKFNCLRLIFQSAYNWVTACIAPGRLLLTVSLVWLLKDVRNCHRNWQISLSESLGCGWVVGGGGGGVSVNFL